ncbi:hypothetical protein ECPA23_5733, partial [Escherichia coli PA23]
MRAPVKWRGG